MGREFLDLFEDWAGHYDASVTGNDPQYEEVFKHYAEILEAVANHSSGTVLEFGVGTGNLSEKLLEQGNRVIGIEPSPAMRRLAEIKLPKLTVFEGDFLEFPDGLPEIDTITSTYAFHHLTNVEKQTAVRKFAGLLPDHGKIVFGDTMFHSEAAKQAKLEEATQQGHLELAADLEREYYPTLDELQNIFESEQFDVTFKQMNEFVWLIVASKHTRSG